MVTIQVLSCVLHVVVAHPHIPVKPREESLCHEVCAPAHTRRELQPPQKNPWMNYPLKPLYGNPPSAKKVIYSWLTDAVKVMVPVYVPATGGSLIKEKMRFSLK